MSASISFFKAGKSSKWNSFFGSASKSEGAAACAMRLMAASYSCCTFLALFARFSLCFLSYVPMVNVFGIF